VFAKEAALEILNNDYRKAKSAISTCIEWRIILARFPPPFIESLNNYFDIRFAVHLNCCNVELAALAIEFVVKLVRANKLSCQKSSRSPSDRSHSLLLGLLAWAVGLSNYLGLSKLAHFVGSVKKAVKK
jgi:hypothetical protein